MLGVLWGCSALHGSAAPAPAPAAPVAAAAPLDPALSARVDPVIDAAISQGQIVGLVVLVARDGQLVYQRAAGYADREAQRAVSAQTQFRLASLTKPMVSVAALVLVEEHVIDLDDPITNWLPAFTPALVTGERPSISVRQLLTHTSGLDYPWDEPAGGPYHELLVSSGFDQPGLSLEENLERLVRAPLLTPPGSAWRYSLGIDVLGGVIAKAGGGTLPEVVGRLVTDPLHLTRTGFSVADANSLAYPYLSATPRPERMTEPQSMPFGADAIVFAPSRIFNPGSYPSGGVGMVGTAADYLSFLEMLRQGGGNVLTPETARAATSNQIAELPVAFAPGWGFGFGFAVMKEADARVPWSVGTWRWIGGYGSHFWVDPSAKLSVVVLTNTTMGGALGPFPDALRDAIYGFVPPAPSPSSKAPALPPTKAPAPPPASGTPPEPEPSDEAPEPE
jgi:CubicO group peptidase (beta-lactamase class C family)